MGKKGSKRSAHRHQGTEKKNRNEDDVCTQGNAERPAGKEGVAPRTGGGWGVRSVRGAPRGQEGDNKRLCLRK